MLVAIIAVLSVAFVLSAVTGVAKGIQWLSNINMVLAVVLALFVFVVGPTVFILNLIPTSLGSYLQELAMMSARTGARAPRPTSGSPGGPSSTGPGGSPGRRSSGMFIARISRGRTIRQFVSGVLLVPSLVSLVWFCVFGGAAIRLQQTGTDIAGGRRPGVPAVHHPEAYPFATAASVLVMVLVAIFFVSGADAASIVMGTLSERGTLEPSRPTVIFWGSGHGRRRGRDAARRR